jgi:hypothetical protein
MLTPGLHLLWNRDARPALVVTNASPITAHRTRHLMRPLWLARLCGSLAYSQAPCDAFRPSTSLSHAHQVLPSPTCRAYHPTAHLHACFEGLLCARSAAWVSESPTICDPRAFTVAPWVRRAPSMKFLRLSSLNTHRRARSGGVAPMNTSSLSIIGVVPPSLSPPSAAAASAGSTGGFGSDVGEYVKLITGLGEWAPAYPAGFFGGVPLSR